MKLTPEEIEATRKILTRDIEAKTADSRENAWRAGPGLAARAVMKHCDSLAAHDTAIASLDAYQRVEKLLDDFERLAANGVFAYVTVANALRRALYGEE